MSQSDVVAALLRKLGTLTFSPALPVVNPNIEAPDEVPAGNYLAASVFPVSSEQIELGETGINRHTGLFQVSVFWALKTGLIKPMQVADAIALAFKRGTILTENSVTVTMDGPPFIAPAQREATRFQIPVRVSYRADIPNP